jgi:hypothetical protein
MELNLYEMLINEDETIPHEITKFLTISTMLNILDFDDKDMKNEQIDIKNDDILQR